MPFLFFLFVFLSYVVCAKVPDVIYLTWTGDPTTTMMLHWHTEEKFPPLGVFYREEHSEKWTYQAGIFRQIPKTDTRVHTLELTSLVPDTTYEFCFEEGSEETYTFHTLEATLKKPLTFVVGGDVYSSAWRFRKMARAVTRENPAFVVLGGDLAYTHGIASVFQGRKWQVARWQSFLKEWKKRMRTQEGHLIPFIPVIGNHDVRPTSLNPFSDNALFYEIFCLPGGLSYRTLDIGNFLSLILLDSGHSCHIEGAQTTWLGERLLEREDRPYKFAVYHVGAYPSVYTMDRGTPVTIRTHWCPLFEKYGVQMAFEHHNHAYKRTYPLIQGKEDARGVVYMGDGSWGVRPRYPKNKERPYFASAEKENAVVVITLEAERAQIKAVSERGITVDATHIESSIHKVSSDQRRISSH